MLAKISLLFRLVSDEDRQVLITKLPNDNNLNNTIFNVEGLEWPSRFISETALVDHIMVRNA